MPQCSKCPNKQSKLNAGELCLSCYKKEKEHDVVDSVENVSEIAGIPLSEIDAIPDLSLTDINQPLTTGTMLKIIAGAMLPLHDKIADHERRIKQLEEDQNKTTETMKKAESENKIAEKRLSVTETKIKNLEEKNEKGCH